MCLAPTTDEEEKTQKSCFCSIGCDAAQAMKDSSVPLKDPPHCLTHCCIECRAPRRWGINICTSTLWNVAIVRARNGCGSGDDAGSSGSVVWRKAMDCICVIDLIVMRRLLCSSMMMMMRRQRWSITEVVQRAGWMCEWSEWLVSWDARAIVRVVGAATQMKVSVFVGRCNNTACTCLLMLLSLSYRRCLRGWRWWWWWWGTEQQQVQERISFVRKGKAAMRGEMVRRQREDHYWLAAAATAADDFSCGLLSVRQCWSKRRVVVAVVVCLRGDECKLVSLLSHFSLFLSLSPSVSPFHHCGEASTRRIECHCSVPYRHPRRPHYGSASVCVQWRWKAAKRRRRRAVHFCNALPSHCHYCNLLHWILLPWPDCPVAQAHHHHHHPLSWLPETRKWKSMKSALRAHIRSRQFFCLNYSQQSWASLAS